MQEPFATVWLNVGERNFFHLEEMSN